MLVDNLMKHMLVMQLMRNLTSSHVDSCIATLTKAMSNRIRKEIYFVTRDKSNARHALFAAFAIYICQMQKSVPHESTHDMNISYVGNNMFVYRSQS